MNEKDAVREERIINEIIVDAYDSSERAMGWYYYLDENITFPFYAVCIKFDKRTPLEKGDEIPVLQLSGENYCEQDIYVDMPWEGRTLAVPLAQIRPIATTDDDTIEAIKVWHYWKKQGYLF
jgi:hypothetical protein